MSLNRSDALERFLQVAIDMVEDMQRVRTPADTLQPSPSNSGSHSRHKTSRDESSSWETPTSHVLTSSFSLGRLQEALEKTEKELYTIVIKGEGNPSNSNGNSFKSFVKHHLKLHLLMYKPDHYRAYPSLACHITPADMRCSKLPKSEIIALDARIGRLLWDIYLRWDYLLPMCLQILGECIQDRSMAYGVPPFLTTSSTNPPRTQPPTGNEHSMLKVSSSEALLRSVLALSPVRSTHCPFLIQTPFNPVSGGRHTNLDDDVQTQEAEQSHDELLLHRVLDEEEECSPKESSPSGREMSRSEVGHSTDDIRPKLKLYHVMREVNRTLMLVAPIFTVISQAQLKAVLMSILVFIFCHDANEGIPLIESRPAPSASQHEGMMFSGKRKNKKAVHIVGRGYWEFNGYGYTCQKLLYALETNHAIDHMFLRVLNLHHLYSWWSLYCGPRRRSLPPHHPSLYPQPIGVPTFHPGIVLPPSFINTYPVTPVQPTFYHYHFHPH